MFCNSIFDRYHNPGQSPEAAYDILKKCIVEIQKRLVVNLPNFTVAIVDENGFRYMEDITKESLKDYNPNPAA